jgi:hypothetical protein
MDGLDAIQLQGLADDALLDVLATLAAGASPGPGLPQSLEQLISLCPRIVTQRWLDTHLAAPLSVLRDARQDLSTGRRSWPWRFGPLERIFAGLDQAFGLKAAQTLARSPEIRAALSPPYLAAATSEIYQILETIGLREAARRHEVLLAAVETDGLEDAAASRRRVWNDWLDVAGKLLGEYQDERIYGLAVDADQALALLAQDDPALQADIAYRFAALLLSPLVALGMGLDAFRAAAKRRLERGVAYPDPDPDPERAARRAIPLPGEALDLAEQRLRTVLDRPGPETAGLGRLRILLATTLLHRLRLRSPESGMSPADQSVLDEAKALIRQAAVELGEDELPLRMEARLLLGALGERPQSGDVPALPHADDLVVRYGLWEATRLVMSCAQLLRDLDPERALGALAEFMGAARRLDEGRRIAFLRSYLYAIFNSRIAEKASFQVAPERPPPSADELVAMIEQRAAAERWSLLDTALALALAGTGATPTGVMKVLDYARWRMPCFAALHAAALDFHLASTALSLPQRVYQITVGPSETPDGAPEVEVQGDAPLGIALIGDALERVVAIGMNDAAIEAIDTYLNIVAFGLPGAAVAIIAALRPRLRALEALAGERAYEPLARLMRCCLGQLMKEAADPQVAYDAEAMLLEALQLAKGHALSTLIGCGVTPAFAGDINLRRQLVEIVRAEHEHAQDSAGDGSGALDEFRLVSPYQAAHEERSSSSLMARLEGLRHSYDSALYSHLLGAASPDTPKSGAAGFARDALPDDTVLLVFYVAEMDGLKFTSFILNNERLTVGTQPIDPDAMRMFIKGEPGMPELDTLASMSLRLRALLLEEPWEAPIAPAAGMMLENWAKLFMGPVATILDDLLAKGKTRLLVVPHGPLHVFPLHLIGPVGHPLCQDWSIRLLPVMQAAGGGRGRGGLRREGVAAFGIDFVQYPGSRWPQLPNAPQESARVAACVRGGTARNNVKATKRAVAHALETSRWVHLSTHGRNDAYAPCFSAIMLWPEQGQNQDDGALATHELLRLNLRGLELVTLSACDLALGRFDDADNVRSIPATLLALGVGAVIGALWQADSAVAETFFVALYAALGGGQSVEQAFGAAQRQTRDQHPAYRDWGVFVLFG